MSYQESGALVLFRDYLRIVIVDTLEQDYLKDRSCSMVPVEGAVLVLFFSRFQGSIDVITTSCIGSRCPSMMQNGA